MNAIYPRTVLVHVSSTESRELHAFYLDSKTGSLQLLEIVSVPGSGSPTRGNIPLAWARNGEILYAHVRTAPFPLSAFAVQPSGKLRLLETVNMPAPMVYLSATRDGRFLLGVSYDGALVTVNPFKANGCPAVPCLQTLPTPPKPHCIIEVPFGGFVYVTSVDGDSILVYHLDEASGLLEPVMSATTPTRGRSGPRHLAFHPTLNRLYCSNEHAGSVGVYRVDRKSGKLHELQYETVVPPTFTGNALAADIHLTPDGKFVFASVRKTNSIVAFHVDPMTGLMSSAGAFEVQSNPRGFAIDPTGRFLLCAGQGSNQVGVYAIDPGSGGLTVVDRHSVGKRPGWIEFAPM